MVMCFASTLEQQGRTRKRKARNIGIEICGNNRRKTGRMLWGVAAATIDNENEK